MVHVVQVLMSVVHGMRGVGRVCEMCMCLARLQEWRRGVDEKIGFGLYESYGNRRSVGRVSVFGLLWCGWCMWGVGRGLGPGSGGVCYVYVSCESGFSVWMSGQCICIL